MLALLLSLLTRFSLPQVFLAVATTAVATVAVAGSAELSFNNRAQADASEHRPVLAVLASPIDVEPDWTVQRVRYQLADVPTSVDAITFTLVAPEVVPATVTVQASNPEGAFYRCSTARAGADIAVTCPTLSPALRVGEANRLYIEVRS